MCEVMMAQRTLEMLTEFHLMMEHESGKVKVPCVFRRVAIPTY